MPTKRTRGAIDTFVPSASPAATPHRSARGTMRSSPVVHASARVAAPRPATARSFAQKVPAKNRTSGETRKQVIAAQATGAECPRPRVMTAQAARTRAIHVNTVRFA